MEGVTVVVEETPTGLVLKVDGELDLETVDAFDRALEPALAGTDGVAVDLSGCSFLDSAALRTLVRADSALSETGRRLALRNPSTVVRRTLELSGLLARFVVEPD